MSFLVYRSSAGSGKTYTLVKEYLKIVLKNPESYRNILALTFTNKAANEMKERLMLFLSGLKQPAENQTTGIRKLMADLSQELGIVEEVIRERATRVMQLILHHYSDLAIGTIDSFVARVIRTFARDLQLTQSFEVELDQDLLIQQSIEKLFLQIGKDPRLTETLVEFTLEKAEDEKGWNIEKDISGFASNILFKEDGQMGLDLLQHLELEDFALIRKKIVTLRIAFENKVLEQASALMRMLSENNLTEEAFYHKKTGFFGNLVNLSSRQTIEKGLVPNSYVLSALNDDVWMAPKISQADRQAFDGLPGFKDAFRHLHQYIRNKLPDYTLYKSLYGNIWSLSLVRELNAMMQEIKEENNVLPIIEFNKRIAQVVLNEPIPFIYERLGERYHYFLIDEFQDTSILQWQNMLPLVENALSEAYQVILVGDGKQSIYRWRGGEVEQFSNLPLIYRKPEGQIHDEREAALARTYQEQVLDTNYRSGHQIIQFNNEFFVHVSAKLSERFRETIFSAKLIEQQALKECRPGMVSLEFIPNDHEEYSFSELTCQRVKDIINEVLTAGYQYGDIAILGRQNEKIGLTAAYLISVGIPVQSPDMLKISASSKVTFLLSCLHWIADPGNLIEKRAIEIFLETWNHQVWPALQADESRNLPVYELCENLVERYTLNKEADPYLLFFLDAVNEYSGKYNVSISGFLEWWSVNENKKVLLTPEEVPAVRMMTIHKAKGLQFPVVILPFLPPGLQSGKDYFWADLHNPDLPELKKVLLKAKKELAVSSVADQFQAEEEKSQLDYLNILYVAMTRPEERLYLLAGMPSKNPENTFSATDMLYNFAVKKGYEDISQCFIMGEKLPKPAISNAKESKNEAFQLQTMYCSSWKEKLSVRFNYPTAWDVSEPRKRRARGENLHLVMAGLTNNLEVDKQLQIMLTHGIIQAEEFEEVSGIVQQVLTHPLGNEFFDAEATILSERDILLPDGSVYRPDRVVCFPDRTLVIDFKSGEKSDHHPDQVLKYAALLTQMNYPSTKAFLVYLDPVEVV